MNYILASMVNIVAGHLALSGAQRFIVHAYTHSLNYCRAKCQYVSMETFRRTARNSG